MGVEGPRQQQLGEQRRVPVGDAGAADGALLGEDLACRLVDRGDAELAERIQHRRLAAARRAGQHEVVVHGIAPLMTTNARACRAGAGGDESGWEIGKPSCRESGCQYVTLTVVAVYLNKR